MHALVCTRLGPPAGAQLLVSTRTVEEGEPGPLQLVSEYPNPKLRPNEVRIRVAAASLNFADALQLQGSYQEKPRLPFIPGSEVSGVVTEVGAEVLHLKPGTAVCAPSSGAFAQECVAAASQVLSLGPSQHLSLSQMQEAAGLPIAFGTAHVALQERAQLKGGEVVLILGAGGGVGVAAVQIAKRMGGRVVAVARGEAKCEVLRQIGADAVIDTALEPGVKLRDRIKQAAPDGVDVLFDNVGGEQYDESLKTLKWGARILVIGFASGKIPKIPANIALVKNLTVHGVYWGSYAKHRPKVLYSSLQLLSEWFRAGEIGVHVSHRFSFEQAPIAFQTLLSRQSIGKVLLIPSATQLRSSL
mmetsp:Transcript_7032/g.13360  ORF Transcript_7032/g.13360 Transcript_7032/m.13360 type:complete len:358 (-) Transcript_7032:405-1478(-)|eukprot:CAMPEP_0114233908 /NCGR_PEP_ID=MMETSP0058-20121206/5431_1 /TAXON_ID=36894 /ORGANISM="Pyramimonas parkeae, CCMP726" /LENGTH=357 /DNA_ID=CAMNT_0001345561 /DNA_START=251 /DNA_END=1324 /DNA_ORIENTATION=+